MWTHLTVEKNFGCWWSRNICFKHSDYLVAQILASPCRLTQRLIKKICPVFINTSILKSIFLKMITLIYIILDGTWFIFFLYRTWYLPKSQSDLLQYIGNLSIHIILLMIFYNYFWFHFTGKRSCVAELIVKKTLFLFVTYFFQKYSISLPKGYKQPDTKPLRGFTNCPKSFHLIITERQ